MIAAARVCMPIVTTKYPNEAVLNVPGLESAISSLTATSNSHAENIEELARRINAVAGLARFSNWIVETHPEIVTEWQAVQKVSTRLDGKEAPVNLREHGADAPY